MPKPTNSLCISFVAIFFGFLGMAQKTVATDTLKMVSYGQAEGLNLHTTNGITKDHMGYLWVGTRDGLYRFNSEDFKIYQNSEKDSLSIPDDFILDVQEFNKKLIINTRTKGVFSFDPTKSGFTLITKGEVYDVFVLDADRIVLPLRDKLVLYNDKTQQIDHIRLDDTDTDIVVTDMAILSPSQCLFTTTKGIFSLNTDSYKAALFAKIDESMHRSILKIGATLFVGTGKGLFAMELPSRKAHQLVKKQIVNDILPKENNDLWLATNNGFYSYNITQEHLTKWMLKNKTGSIIGKVISYQIFDGGDGNIFFSTVGEGLWHYNKKREKFNTLKLKLPGYSKSRKLKSYQVLPHKDTSIFIGTTDNILKYDFNKKSFKHYDSFAKSVITSITKDPQGTVWTGGYKTGLLRYDPVLDDFIIDPGAKGFFKDKIIINIMAINQKELLVGTYFNNTYVYHRTRKEIKPYLVDGAALFQSRVSYTDSQNNLWLGTDENGLYKVDPLGNTIHYHAEGSGPHKISHNHINGITEDTMGHIWVATSSGLNKYNADAKTFTAYHRQNGFPNDYVYAVEADARDNIWVATNWGLSVLNQEKGTFTNYTADDGLQNNEFNTKASYKDANGKLYFGGVDGINIFHPDSINQSSPDAKVYIERVDLFNHPLDKERLSKDKLTFKSSENVITFHYAAINYINPKKVNYAYFLEGFDQEWREINHQKSATYTNLDPGSYTFKVKATNDNGTWSKNRANLKIVIRPPWYKTIIFRVSVLLLLASIIIGIFKYRSYQEKVARKKLEKIIRARTSEIIKKNTELESAYATSEAQKDNIRFLMKELKHRTKNNLQIISSLLNIQSNQIADKDVQKILQTAKNRILTMSHLEQFFDTDKDSLFMDDFIKVLCDTVLSVLGDENDLKFSVVYQLDHFEVKTPNTSLLGLIINELLTNIVKHAFEANNDQNQVHISCTLEQGNMVLSIADNGKGYQPEQIKQDALGINLVHGLLRQINAKIEIKSTPLGTINKMVLPVEKYESYEGVNS